MSHNRSPEPGSAEDLEAKGLVPTMWDSMAAAQAASREGEFDAPDASPKKAPAGAHKQTDSSDPADQTSRTVKKE